MGKIKDKKNKLKRKFTLSLRLNGSFIAIVTCINTAKMCCFKKVLTDFTIVIREIEIKVQEEKNKHCYRFFSSC